MKQTYKSDWTIPGGVMEANGETPWQACRREVAEECGIDVRSGQLACVDFRPGKPGGIRLLFDCGTMDDQSLAAIVIQPEEIPGYRIIALPGALRLLRARSGAGCKRRAAAGDWSTWKTAARCPRPANRPATGPARRLRSTGQ